MSNKLGVSKARWAIYLKLNGYIKQMGTFFKQKGNLLSKGELFPSKIVFFQEKRQFEFGSKMGDYQGQGRHFPFFLIYVNSTPAKD